MLGYSTALVWNIPIGLVKYSMRSDTDRTVGSQKGSIETFKTPTCMFTCQFGTQSLTSRLIWWSTGLRVCAYKNIPLCLESAPTFETLPYDNIS